MRDDNGTADPGEGGLEGEPEDLERDLRLLTAPPACLTRHERRDALRLARRLGRTIAENENVRTVTLAVYRDIYVKIARVTKNLVDAGYWRRDEAVLDARLEAIKRGFAERRAEGR